MADFASRIKAAQVTAINVRESNELLAHAMVKQIAEKLVSQIEDYSKAGILPLETKLKITEDEFKNYKLYSRTNSNYDALEKFTEDLKRLFNDVENITIDVKKFTSLDIEITITI